MLRATRKVGAIEQLMASLLAIAVAGYSVPTNLIASTVASDVAEISGIILLPDGLTPVTGVKVKAANLETKQIYSSETTGRDGVYRLASLPAGTYDIAVETPGGLYASDRLVDTVAGGRRVISLAIRSSVQEGQESETPVKGQTPQEDKPSSEPQSDQAGGKKKGKTFWKSFEGQSLIVGIAAVVGFVALHDWTQDHEGDDDSGQMSKTKRSN